MAMTFANPAKERPTRAMYQPNRRGATRFRLFNEDMSADTYARLGMEQESAPGVGP